MKENEMSFENELEIVFVISDNQKDPQHSVALILKCYSFRKAFATLQNFVATSANTPNVVR